jgi:type IV pilus assembly protein PilP
MKLKAVVKAVLTPAMALALGVYGSACGSSTTTTAAPPPPPKRAAPAASSSATTLAPQVNPTDYTENDFVESDHNRDPFRSFLVQNQSVKQVSNQRKTELSQYALDELKLVAIVLGSDQPRAMFVDPSGKGTVVYKGTFICRPEVVHIGGSNGPEYQLNWRVDRIRAGDVVLIREDPAQPAIPPATRVIALHPESEKEALAP